MKTIKHIPFLMVFILGLSLCSLPVSAEENVDELKAQIEALQKQVEELEAAQSKETQQPPTPQQAFPFSNRFNRFGESDLFEDIQRMQEEINRMFQHSFSNRDWLDTGMFSNNLSFDSDIDLKEIKDGYEIRFDMTGLDKEKVDIQINEHSIAVKGEHSREDTQKSPNRYFYAQSFGSFMKTIPLPVDADTSKMKTEKERNSLVIRMPKKTS